MPMDFVYLLSVLLMNLLADMLLEGLLVLAPSVVTLVKLLVVLEDLPVGVAPSVVTLLKLLVDVELEGVVLVFSVVILMNLHISPTMVSVSNLRRNLTARRTIVAIA